MVMMHYHQNEGEPHELSADDDYFVLAVNVVFFFGGGSFGRWNSIFSFYCMFIQSYHNYIY